MRRLTSVLYAGLMIMADGTFKVIKWNHRFGDPETQAIMMRLSSDLVDCVEAALDSKVTTNGIRVLCATALGNTVTEAP
jgi:phosphoribosylamine--glycine ligase